MALDLSVDQYSYDLPLIHGWQFLGRNIVNTRKIVQYPFYIHIMICIVNSRRTNCQPIHHATTVLFSHNNLQVDIFNANPRGAFVNF